MADGFEVVEKAIGPVIEIEERVPVWRMPSVFGRDYKKIAEYINAQGAEVVYMPYARYQDMDLELELNRGKLSAFLSMFTKQWHFFAGMPTSKPLSTAGELTSRELTRRKFARAVHRGPYKECGKTYSALRDWAVARGLQLQNEAFEFYLNDPREVGPSEAETEILVPLK